MDDKLTTRDLKIHGFYIVLILGGCLVFQTVFVWSKIPNVPELISFAVGLTSLVLAVIAIVQNLISSPQVVNSLQKLSGVGDDIRRSTETLTAASAAFSAKLHIMEAIPADVGLIKEGIDRLSAIQANTPVAETELSMNISKNPLEPVPLDLLATPSTYGGLLAVYILARTQSLSSFNLATLFPNDTVTVQYISGYFACLRDNKYITYVSKEAEFTDMKIIAKFDAATAIAKTQSSKSDDFVKPRMVLIDAFITQYNEKIAALPVL